MDLSLIIVSYNTATLTCDCIESVIAADGGNRKVFDVDNASEIIKGCLCRIALTRSIAGESGGMGNQEVE